MTTTTRESMTYKLGKIYQIQPIVEHEEGEIYIGSTCCKYLSQRMKAHRGDYKCWKEGKRDMVTSFNLFEKFGIENCQILLIENVNCENINELKTREAYYIRTLKCVNKCIPLRTKKEWCEDNKDKIKEHRDTNKDKMLEYAAEYRVVNKDEITKKDKERYEKNKEKKLEQAKEYREANLDKEKERHKKYYEKNKATIAEKRRLQRQAKKEAKNKI